MVTSVESNPVGVPLRKPTVGVESEVVARFLEGFIASKRKQSSSAGISVFVEPRLEYGFPDLLIAYHNPRRVAPWGENRDSLSERDFKILSYLMKHPRKRHSVDSITRALGFRVSQVEMSLGVLEGCGFLAETGGVWRCAARSSFFALTGLVSIEAKVGKPGVVLEQATKNTVFSSQSYSLLAGGRVFDSTKSRFAARGVGIILGESGQVVLKAEAKPVPVCTTSLRVNEWITRQYAGMVS